jgi:activator of HSP90 ATPase
MEVDDLKPKRIVGLTKSHGYQISISKTFNVSCAFMWDFILSEEGINIWLGKSDIEELEFNMPFKTVSGVEGKLKSFKPAVYFKFTWKAAVWTNNSNVEVRINNRKGKARLGILQSFMISLDQRTAQKAYWDEVMLKIERKIKKIG